MNDDFRRAMGGGMPVPAGRGPAPRRGQDRDFDRYFDEYLGDEVPEGDIGEMRTAAWMTWRTDAPVPNEPHAHVDNEDDDLARALALSREELLRPDTQQREAQVPDDDDELARAIALSEEEARAPKRQRREETPEEERRQLEEALAASLAAESSRPRWAPAGEPSVPSRTNVMQRTGSDDLIRAANDEYQAQRVADRAAQAKARQAKLEAASRASTPPSSAPTIVQRPSPPPQPHQPGTVNSLLADRARMEEERLARQNARAGGQTRTQSSSAAQVPAPASASSSAAPRIQSASAAQPRTIHTVSEAGPSAPRNGNGNANGNGNTDGSGSTSRARPSTQHPYQATGSFPRDAAGEYYLDGELRHNALTIGNPSMDSTFTLKGVIGDTSQISLLILNSYVIDDEWLGTILPSPDAVPQILIRPHPKEDSGRNGKIEAQLSGEVWIYPKMVGEYHGSQHMKYLWIFYKTGRLRVVISTANFVTYDWQWIQNVGRIRENTTFVQDFLPLPTPTALRTGHKQHDFPLQFKPLFRHLKVHKAIQFLKATHEKGNSIPIAADAEFGDMAKYDWSRVTVRLVLSIPGTYEGWEEMEKWGLCRIGQVAKEEGWKPAKGEKAAVEYQGSSLGSYGIDWFTYFHQLCSGKSARELANLPKAKNWAPINIIFPSLATVDSSLMGRRGGGTMFAGKAWNSVMKPRFHDCNSKSGGVLIHAKLLVVTFEPQEQSLGMAPIASPVGGKRKADVLEDERRDVGGWMYVGSHNFSVAAWGTVNVKKNPPTLNIKNYELGIMFPLPREGARKMADRIVPYQRPPRPYSATDVPWDQTIHPIPE